MILETLSAIALGIAIGIITGLTPGLHSNLAALLMAQFLVGVLAPLPAAIAIAAMVISHTVFDFIPSVFLGAPDESKVAAVLPGHQMLLHGRGMDAVAYSLLGMWLGALAGLALVPVILVLLPLLAERLAAVVGYALLFLIGVMVWREKDAHAKALALIVVVLAAILGIATFSAHLADPLLPLLSGLFGVSLLLGNFSQDAKIPPQILDLSRMPIRPLLIPSSCAALVGALLNLFPGVGPSQASIITLEALKVKRAETVIATVNAVAMGSLLGSLAAMVALEKARNAPIAYMAQLVRFDLFGMVAFMAASVAALGISSYLAIKLAPRIVSFLGKIPYGALTACIIALVVCMVLLRSGLLGFAVFLVAIAVGLIAQGANIGKHHLMACLLVPTAGYFIL